MEFKFKHHETGEERSLFLSEKEMSEMIDRDDLLDEFYKEQCKCQPVGETNVIECNCDEFLSEFELIEE